MELLFDKIKILNLFNFFCCVVIAAWRRYVAALSVRSAAASRHIHTDRLLDFLPHALLFSVYFLWVET